MSVFLPIYMCKITCISTFVLISKFISASISLHQLHLYLLCFHPSEQSDKSTTQLLRMIALSEAPVFWAHSVPTIKIYIVCTLSKVSEELKQVHNGSHCLLR